MPATNNAALLEKRLTLVSWFAGVLGYEDNAEMLRSLKNAGEGWSNEYNHVLERWLSEDRARDDQVEETLQMLDSRIRSDWEMITRRRDRHISLKYFQYLAALASEMFLHRLAESPEALWRELQRHSAGKSQLEAIPDADSLYKLAFWMATGSGKTLLLHLHYRQFLRYRHDLFTPDNILLITPNEELSRQHITEMEMSGIPCFRHGGNSALLNSKPDAVRVIEITKLLHEQGRRGRGKSKSNSLYVEELDGRNLLFVDEGHKGAGGDVWFTLRNKLVNRRRDKHGFVFEYSATFGQALKANVLYAARSRQETRAREYDRAKEYARSILFDYSYRYFYDDGYGKEFSILGIHTDADDAKSEQLLMLGNLLAFFEQQWLFKQNETALFPYKIEKPLQLLIGSTVTGGAGEEDKLSDVRKILYFLNQVATDKNADGQRWLQEAIRKLFNEQSGMKDGEGRDLFADHFQTLKTAFPAGRGLPQELRKILFYADNKGTLRFSVLKQAKGEASLQVGENKPFALVYVGSSKKLSQLVAQDGLEAGNEAVRLSLFSGAHLPTSPINILIGAKKFMEGWSSWRVSSLGLLNVGRSEGTNIIQLFGRGVRLQGKDFSLKRSPQQQRRRLAAELSQSLEALEKLNIFAIRADFMGRFRSYLESEGVMEVPFPIKIKMMDEGLFAGKNLQTLQFPPAVQFQETVVLEPQEGIAIKLDYSVKTQRLASDQDSINIADGGAAAEGGCFPARVTALLDFDFLYCALLEYKEQQRRGNLIIHRDQLEAILQNNCQVLGGGDIFNAAAGNKLRRLHSIAFTALRKYAERLYYHRQKQWEIKDMRYMPLFDENRQPAVAVRDNFIHYEVRVPQEEERRIKAILALLEKERLYRGDGNDGVPRVAFDRHLYIPLLLEEKGLVITPPGLNDSEAKFVKGVRSYLNTAAGRQMKENVFLLRNLGRGKGVGFYEDEGFFPDFILWIKHGGRQRIVFIEPHGMWNAPAYDKDFKARLWESLQKLSRKLQKRRQWKNISVDSYLISETPFDKLRNRYGDGNWDKDKFKSRHILFAEDADYINQLFSAVTAAAHDRT